MMHLRQLAVEFFAHLERMDEQIAMMVAAGGCTHCEGPLYRSDYQRKPRGGLFASAGEAFARRHSLCCGRPGCRKRALPPSVRFLGRRVYLEAVVILASLVAQMVAAVRDVVAATGVRARTLRRWGSWWRETLPGLRTWAELRARFIPPPPDEAELPRSLLARLGFRIRADTSDEGESGAEALALAARFLAPATTESVVDGSRFVTAAAELAVSG